MTQDPNFNSGDLIAFIYGKRKPLIIITSVAIVVSVAVSLMMTPYFKAQAIVFPTKSNSVDFQGTGRNSVVEFGDEADAERLLQVLISPEIRDSLTNKYKLYEHYDIDTTSGSGQKAKFQKAYEGNVQFNRTRYNSITIDVYDADPKIAANMANDVVRLVDTVMNRMIRERSKGPMWAVQDEVRLIKTEMGDYSDKMKSLSDSGVVNQETRSRLYSDYLAALKAGKSDLASEIKRKIDASQKYGSDYDVYSNLSEFFSLRYSNILDVNDQATQFAHTNIQQTIRHSMAEVPDKKAKPKRAIIVVMVTAATFFLTIFWFLAVEKLKELKKTA
jgi:LPS O-antigen subunit length determinant protein (WzzB/FepE family)